MNCKYLIVPVALALSWPCFGQPERHEDSPARDAVVLTVDQAVAEARESNPEIRAAVRRLTLAQMKTSTAGSLEDPMFTVRDWQTPLSKPWDLNQAQLMFMMEQTYPSQEKRDSARRGWRSKTRKLRPTTWTRRAQRWRSKCARPARTSSAMPMRSRCTTTRPRLLKEALAGAMAEYTTGKVRAG